MNLTDIIALALRNLSQAKLRTALTVIGVVVGVAAIVTLVSFGLGLQQNILGQALSKLDVFTSITVRGASADMLLELNEGRSGSEIEKSDSTPAPQPADDPNSQPTDRFPRPRRVLDDEAVLEIGRISGVKYALPVVNFSCYLRYDGRVRRMNIGGAPAGLSDYPRFRTFLAGRAFAGENSDEAVVTEEFLAAFSPKGPQDRRNGRPRGNGPFAPAPTKSEAERAADAAQVIGKGLILLIPRSAQTSTESVFGIPMISLSQTEKTDESVPENEQSFDQHIFKIAGVIPSEGGINFNPFGSPRVILPMETAKRFRDFNRDPTERLGETLAGDSGYMLADVRVVDPTQIKPVMDQVEKLGFRAFSITTQMDEINRIFLIINASLGLIGGIALLVASFGISNTMIMSIRERTREIGIMKAIGGSDGEIMKIFFVEASMIGLAGGTLGVLAGWVVDRLANSLANTYIVKNAASHIEFFSIPWYLSAGAILFAIMISLIAAIYPAMRAAKVDPIRALRYE